MNHEHFTLDTSAQALVLKGTMETVQGCTSMACSASGAMEYTDGIFEITDALPRATTAFFHAVRLSDFKAFSSEKYNAFTYGFQGNNLTSGGSYPQARITAKWIKGFYCGRLFAGELVLENTVYNNSSVLWQYKVANGGGQSVSGLTDPTTAVVDLAIEGVEGGARVNFYYRTGGTQSGMDKASGGWTLYASYDNAALPFYGYPVNKGLLTLSASDLAYPPTVPTDNPINSAQSIAVTEYSTESASAGDLSRDYRVINFEPASNVKRIVYTCTSGALTAIRAAFSGLDKSPSQLNIVKLRPNGQSRPFKTYRTTFSGVDSGDWAIAEAWGTNNFVPAGQSMIAGAQYYLYLFIRDNDPDYDLNMTAGIIEDPAVLGIGTPGLRAPAGGPTMLLLEGAQ
ncbi:hypothetical protein [Desulfovibrio sp. TomC]|uniref:hypothetical protein n=1 Tax=Desulfovibrio sp. TomC TaxID=1562888 RepID=UPI0005740722|nr:hypothetical protein [Desulfovibrio sp. TomC]KHK03131.1 hypothetical protein NY78_1660 [Desulfovibrio sp. TomC]